MGDLIRHKCGQTPRYACPYCHKKDNSSSNVYRHIRRWHPKMPDSREVGSRMIWNGPIDAHQTTDRCWWGTDIIRINARVSNVLSVVVVSLRRQRSRDTCGTFAVKDIVISVLTAR